MRGRRKAWGARKACRGAGECVAKEGVTNLTQVAIGETRIITDLDTRDEAVNDFLLRLGCYRGERITLLNRTKHMCTVVIKNSRYSIDTAIARSIIV
ncbi:MAG: ferrous iron transport protein A [Arcanobacterium sp.]